MYRPTLLKDYIGSLSVKTLAETVAMTARTDIMATPHVLLTGLPGTGKTTLARIIANEAKLPLAEFIGDAVEYDDIVAKISILGRYGCIVFLDEIHSVEPKLLERLYPMMEDNVLIQDNRRRKAEGKIIVIGATTEKQQLASPLMDRFGIKIEVPPYTRDSILDIITHAILAQNTNPPDTNAMLIGLAEDISSRSKNIPRRALSAVSLLSAFLNTHYLLDNAQQHLLLPHFEIYKYGLDAIDMRILGLLNQSTQPIGLSMMSLCINEDPRYISKKYEPFLFANGYARKSVMGRSITDLGRVVFNDVSQEKEIAKLLAYSSKYENTEASWE